MRVTVRLLVSGFGSFSLAFEELPAQRASIATAIAL
jgi:hypothetical protein